VGHFYALISRPASSVHRHIPVMSDVAVFELDPHIRVTIKYDHRTWYGEGPRGGRLREVAPLGWMLGKARARLTL